MNPQEFIAFASRIANSKGDAADYRSAISRAYYGAYHSARRFIETEIGIRCRGGGSEHALLQRYLRQSKEQDGMELGKLLENLHESRREADYDLHLSTTERQEEAKLCVVRANKIIAKVQHCSTRSEIKDRIKRGIQLYLATINQS